MEILHVYDDGAILGPEVFNLDTNTLLGKMRAAAKNIAAISLAIGQPNALSIPHMISGGFKNIISIALEADIKIKALANLSAAAPAATTTTTSAPAKKEEAKPVEKEEEPDVGLGGGLFGDDDDF
jgi:large subunit ribosomal protein LP0